MKHNQTECLLGHGHPSISRSDCKKPHTLSRRIVWWCRGRTSHGRWLLRLMLFLGAILCGAIFMLFWKQPTRYSPYSITAITNTSDGYTEPTASGNLATTTALDLSLSTCPTQQEQRTSLHFEIWDRALIQQLRSSDRDLPKTEEESWRPVTDGVHVFSAFITTTVQHTIHVVSLVQFRDSNGTSIETPPLVCAVRTSGGVTEHTARVRAVWTWLEPRLKSAFILCPAPANYEGEIQVTISARGSSEGLSLWIPVHRPPEKSEQKCCAVCVRPIFGPAISLWKVAEFIAHYRLMGARNFYFYDLEMPNDMKVLLSHMQMNGVDITVVPFKLLVDSSEVHAQGQMAGLYDCMFRSMSKSEYFIHVDLDEFIVPVQYSNISALVYGVEATSGADVVGSIVVPSTYYCAEYPLNVVSMQHRQAHLQTRIFNIHTGYIPSDDVTKYIGRTRTICNAAVHTVAQHCGHFVSVLLLPSVARINHYRRCCEYTSFDPVKRWGITLWTPSQLFLDDTVEARADAIEKELAIMGLHSVLRSTSGD
ncbi:uncharacterized protein LOC144162584 isoform X2 [Haemaphysalis longicornis]